MQLFVMRHGHTNYNALGLCNDDPARPAYLTEQGRQQAREAAEQLRHIPLDRIIVSQLPRTRQTADIVNQYHQVPLHTHAALNDIVTGFDSRPVEAYFAATGADRLHIRPPGGESLLDYKTRVLSFLPWLGQKPWERVLVIAHEETLRVLSAHFRQLDNREMQQLHFGNCEIVEFILQAGLNGISPTNS